MSSHPINLTIRFLLEITALLAIGIWGWKLGVGWVSYAFALGIPIIIGSIWGVFAVPDDPSRSGSAPIPVPGIVRLIIEISIFAFAIWALDDIGSVNLSWTLGTITVIHYFASYDRIIWLIKQR